MYIIKIELTNLAVHYIQIVVKLAKNRKT